MKYKANLNNYVWVKLRPKGRQLLKNYWSENYPPRSPEETLDIMHPGWQKDEPIKMQIHTMMLYFGDAMHMGSELPIETIIEIETEE